MDPRTYAEEITRTLHELLLPGTLRGVWLVGSLAWDDYHPASSDIDVMAVAEPQPPEVRLAVAEAVAALECPARQLEFVLYPPGEDQPSRWQLNLNTNPHSVSIDPASEPAHWFVLDVAMARERAVPLFGPPAHELLAPVPLERIHHALEQSLGWHDEHDAGRPNQALNACRAWLFAETGRWASKTTAAHWARERLDDPSLIDAALAERGNG